MKVLAIDWGTKKMGLAIGDTEGGIAFPHRTITASDMFAALADVIAQEKIEKVIVGLPLRSAGEETETSTEVRVFAERVRVRFKVSVELTDERMTTQLARRFDRRAGMDDALAAQILLQEYFDKLMSK